MAIGQSFVASVGTPAKIGLVVFDGTAGQRVSLDVTNGTFVCWQLSILNPNGSTLVSPTTLCPNGFFEPVTLPQTGTYTIVIDPPSTETGSTTLRLYDVPPDPTYAIVAGGPAVTATTTVPGQTATLTFAGTAGQRVSLDAANATFGCWQLSIRNPDGSTLHGPATLCPNGFVDPLTLPQAGTYTLVVNPAASETGSVTLTLYDVPPDPTGPIEAGGAAVTATTTVPGQVATRTFTGAIGQRVSLDATNATFTCWQLSLRHPDGSTLHGPATLCPNGFVEPLTLTQTGTHTIIVDPPTNQTGSVTLRLYDVPADATYAVTLGGAAATATITTPGQNARVTFFGTAGPQVTVHATGNALGCLNVTLLKPDTTSLVSTFSCSASFDLVAPPLPVGGTYTVLCDPGGPSTGSITVGVTTP
jgi:hypothetical protein